MKISLFDLGKRFNRDWVFRNLSYDFTTGIHYSITGPNGSGKSTLLQIIGGALSHSSGRVTYSMSGAEAERSSEIRPEHVYRHLAIAAPYIELVEEMTAREFMHFHHQFKPWISAVNSDEILAQVGLSTASNKLIRFFSSGMKQRLKLAQAIFSNVPCILLDEPCTNLDEEGILLYHRLITRYCSGRLVIVASNDAQEYDFCQENLNIALWKT